MTREFIVDITKYKIINEINIPQISPIKLDFSVLGLFAKEFNHNIFNYLICPKGFLQPSYFQNYNHTEHLSQLAL